MDNIGVQPQTNLSSVKVATDEIEVDGKKVHYPIYKIAVGEDGEAILIDEDNPIPITLTANDINRHSHLKESIDELVLQMKILNKYMAEGFDNEIKEEDLV